MHFISNSIFAALLFSSVCYAADVETCHQFTASDTRRLLCYDKATGFAGTKNSETSDSESGVAEVQIDKPKTTSNWLVESEVSDIDDTTNVFMRLSSDDDIRGRFGGAGPMRLFIACRENTTSMWITFNDLHMSDYQYGTVTYRLDKTPAKKKKMYESTDNRALGLWRGGSSIPFVKGMFGHEKMLVKATPYGESAVQATFTISGLEDEVAELREACHW